MVLFRAFLLFAFQIMRRAGSLCSIDFHKRRTSKSGAEQKSNHQNSGNRSHIRILLFVGAIVIRWSGTSVSNVVNTISIV